MPDKTVDWEKRKPDKGAMSGTQPNNTVKNTTEAATNSRYNNRAQKGQVEHSLNTLTSAPSGTALL